MTRVSFRSLKPNVTRNEAVETFRGRGPGAFLRRLRNGALRCVADVYVPFRLYRVEIANGAAAQRHWFALDAVNGMLDLYEFARVPDGARRLLVARLDAEPAKHAFSHVDVEAAHHLLLGRRVFREVDGDDFDGARALATLAAGADVHLHLEEAAVARGQHLGDGAVGLVGILDGESGLLQRLEVAAGLDLLGI